VLGVNDYLVGDVRPALLTLLGAVALVLLIAAMSTLGKPFFSIVLTVAATRMVLSGAYEVGGSHGLYRVSGGFGLALAALAMYGGTALGLEDALHRDLLPLFRRGKADEAFHGFEAQLERIEAEPGVRQQL